MEAVLTALQHYFLLHCLAHGINVFFLIMITCTWAACLLQILEHMTFLFCSMTTW